MNEREWDRRLRIKTTGREDVSDANYAPYEPTPYPVLERLAASGHLKRKHRLLDYGCGKGRVMFFLADQVGCHATGIEQSEKLYALARENRRTARTGDRVILVHRLAEQYELQDEDSFFFFNPFSEAIFTHVLSRITDAWYLQPREMRLFCYYPSEEYLQALQSHAEIRLCDAITFEDIFGRKDPRERLNVYAIGQL
ncbi:MAG: class I SAM-dependent methyltransferase [Clostridiales bacterium]|nr:class I SAM-dependent methyltransferase [Clostridiales bacterium]